jgi:hypothetical protein
MARHEVLSFLSLRDQSDAPPCQTHSLGRSSADSLDVVPRRIDHKRGIVRRPEMRPHARLAIALATRSDSRLVERLNSSPI